MTTVREQIENGVPLNGYIQTWRRNKGIVPMCCYESKKVKGKELFKCSWLNVWYPIGEFTRLCLECQKRIEVLIKSINVKNRSRRILFDIATKEDMEVTAIDPCIDMIILNRGEDSDEECESEIEEVVNHECLHIIVKRIKSYSVCFRLDKISGWMTSKNKKYKIVFVDKKRRIVIFQLPE